MKQATGYLLVKNVFDEVSAANFALAATSSLGVSNLTAETGVEFAMGSFPRQPDLWNILNSGRLLAALREEVGSDVAILTGIDTIAVNGSESEFHRDSSYGFLPSVVGDNDVRYSVTRAIFYPSANPSHANTFRIVPGSHLLHASTEGADGSAVDIAIGPRDVLLFDARCIHAGAPPQGTKVLVVLTFGQVNALSLETITHEHSSMHEDGYNLTVNEGFCAHISELGLGGLTLPTR